MYNNGISVIICCYNSDWILRETLNAFLKQKNIDSFNWEIIIVDNVCTDNTANLVREYVLLYPTLNIQLVNEGKPGLIHAREKGISVSKYSYLLFCDDDNILCDTYLQQVYSIMETDTLIGACGGIGRPNFLDEKEPFWFNIVSQAYATGTQLGSDGKNVRGNYLYGAGVCFRKSALDKLYKTGFKPLLTGRKGKVLSAGDDSELTKALQIIGFKIVASDLLEFIHVLPAKRLNEGYLCNMFAGFGQSYIYLYLYDIVLASELISVYRFFFWKQSLYLRFVMHKIKFLFFRKILNKVYVSYYDSAITEIKEKNFRKFYSYYMQILDIRKNNESENINNHSIL